MTRPTHEELIKSLTHIDDLLEDYAFILDCKMNDKEASQKVLKYKAVYIPAIKEKLTEDLVEE